MDLTVAVISILLLAILYLWATRGDCASSSQAADTFGGHGGGHGGGGHGGGGHGGHGGHGGRGGWLGRGASGWRPRRGIPGGWWGGYYDDGYWWGPGGARYYGPPESIYPCDYIDQETGKCLILNSGGA